MDETKEIVNSSIKISDEVIETIASVAVSEIEGVSSMGTGFVDGIARRITKKSMSAGIKANVNDNSVLFWLKKLSNVNQNKMFSQS